PTVPLHISLNQSEHAIVGGDKPGIAHTRQNRFSIRAHPRIDHDNMDCFGREVPPRLPDCKGPIEYVKSLDSMGDIDHMGGGTDGRDHALHDSDEGVGEAKIRGERDKRSSGHCLSLSCRRRMTIRRVWMSGFDKACYS